MQRAGFPDGGRREPAQLAGRVIPPGKLYRFIPARAGNTPQAPAHRPVWRGSSPRERGTHLLQLDGTIRKRFIPARAGNTFFIRPFVCKSPVHPRASGEHFFHPAFRLQKPGSSPRERGTRPGVSDEGKDRRFIPARAGNTSVRSTSRALLPVHPRASGEHRGRIACFKNADGSSPRERGTLLFLPGHFLHCRFIPARAGNTRRIYQAGYYQPVHPRASGEH